MGKSNDSPKPYAFLAQAKDRFAFLEGIGFKITKEHEGTYYSFKDGFWLHYECGNIEVRITYTDNEFCVSFKKNKLHASYLFIDTYIFANASGWAGDMFPFETLAPEIDAVAADIATNYLPILRGETGIWQKIEKLANAPREKKTKLP
jgi:hypothetical protein